MPQRPRHPRSGMDARSKSSKADWPKRPEAAFQGLAGELVALVEPHTEADPMAILAHALAGYTAAVGAGPYFELGAGERHCARLFEVIVGRTSKARKGSSWAPVRLVLSRIDEQF